MARKRYSDEDILKLLREGEGHIHSGMNVVCACRKVGVSDKAYYDWRKKFGGLMIILIGFSQGWKNCTCRFRSIVQR